MTANLVGVASVVRLRLCFAHVVSIFAPVSRPGIVGDESRLEVNRVTIRVDFATGPFVKVRPSVVCVANWGCECVDGCLVWVDLRLSCSG
jgi:hypothetical protein